MRCPRTSSRAGSANRGLSRIHARSPKSVTPCVSTDTSCSSSPTSARSGGPLARVRRRPDDPRRRTRGAGGSPSTTGVDRAVGDAPHRWYSMAWSRTTPAESYIGRPASKHDALLLRWVDRTRTGIRIPATTVSRRSPRSASAPVISMRCGRSPVRRSIRWRRRRASIPRSSVTVVHAIVRDPASTVLHRLQLIDRDSERHPWPHFSWTASVFETASAPLFMRTVFRHDPRSRRHHPASRLACR